MVDSAGILLHRGGPAAREVLLGHLGGPFWTKRHEGAWSIPKGVVEPGESLLEAARREFAEELGVAVPAGDLVPLGSVRQSKKVVHVWALAADLDPVTIAPGEFEMEWPPRSGTMASFPELDRVAWFDLSAAAEVVITAQRVFLERLAEMPD
jgi:predicted NUDIX family NTP pyrophosphohydrolase